MKDHLSMVLKLRFRVLQCSRNDIFLCAFVNTLSFFGLRQAAQCQRLYSTPATDAPVLMADRSGRPSSPSPPRPPTPTHNGAAAGISATREVSHSSLHFLSILCHKTFHRFAAKNLTSSHAKKKSKSVGQFVRYNQFCDVMFTRFLAEIGHMFGSL